MAMKKVVENYIKLLPFVGLTADETGKISIGGGEFGIIKPFLVDGKEVYLPTQEFLKTADKSKVGFHPLCESVIMKPSPVLKGIQDAMNHRLNAIALTFIKTIINAAIAQKKDTLKSKDPNLMSVLVGNEDCTTDTANFFEQILQSIVENNDGQKIIRVYLKHGGEIRDEKYLRICSISSPLLEQLERPGVKEVFGVAPKRKKDIAVLTHVIKTAFPGLDSKEYTKGSSDGSAPYMDALLKSLEVLSKDINTVARNLKEAEPVTSLLQYITVIESDLEEFEDYDMLRNQVPPLPYNDGSAFLTDVDKRRVELVEKVDPEPIRRQDPTPVRMVYDKPQVEPQQAPTPTPAPVAYSAPQQVARIPGARQPLYNVSPDTDVVQNDYTDRPRRGEDRTRNSGYGGGRDHDSSRHDERRLGFSSSRDRHDEPRRSNRRPHIDDFRDLRDVEDAIAKTQRQLKDAEYDRAYREADDLKDELKDLYDIEDRLRRRREDDRRYDSRDDRNDRSYRNDRNERSYSNRPVPRGAQGARRQERRREEPDRFGRNNRR